MDNEQRDAYDRGDPVEPTDDQLDAAAQFRVPDDIDARPRDALIAAINAARLVGPYGHAPAGIADDLKSDADRAYGRAVDVLSAAVARAVARDSVGTPVDLIDTRRIVGYLLASAATAGLI